MVEQETENLCVGGSSPPLGKMIKVQTKLQVADNCGARWAKCIKIIGKGKKTTSNIGNTILVTLSNFFTTKKVQKRTIYLGLIVTVRQWVSRLDGLKVKFFSNRVLIFNKQYKFLGTRVYGGVFKEIKSQILTSKKDRKHFQKIISYSSLII